MMGPDMTMARCVAVDGVLARYGLLTHGYVVDGHLADRGDLSSDLVTAIEAADSEAGRTAYEAVLDALWRRLAVLYAGHAEHRRPTKRRDGDPPEWVCGGPDPNDRCNELAGLFAAEVDAAFPDEDAESWLACPPHPDWPNWGTPDGGTIGEGRLIDFAIEMLRWDAECRVLPPDGFGLIPVDPATTTSDPTDG